jgi:tetratricopeptide (TPR) repeat protein
MIRKSLSLVFVFLISSALMAPPVGADDGEIDIEKAERVRDRAISKTVPWRPKSAENILNKERKYETTQPFMTAEAFLMATYSLGQDEKLLKRGLDILTKQAKRDPSDPVAEFYRGEVLKWMDQKDEAKTAWDNARKRAAALIEKNSKNSRAHYYLGAALVRLRKPGDARKALKKAEKNGFDQPMIDFQVGLTYLLEEKWKPAVNAFDDVHELDPRFAHLYFYRGLAWDKLGRKDNLLIDFDQFVKLAPNSLEAKTARAILAAAG